MLLMVMPGVNDFRDRLRRVAWKQKGKSARLAHRRGSTDLRRIERLRRRRQATGDWRRRRSEHTLPKSLSVNAGQSADDCRDNCVDRVNLVTRGRGGGIPVKN